MTFNNIILKLSSSSSWKQQVWEPLVYRNIGQKGRKDNQSDLKISHSKIIYTNFAASKNKIVSCLTESDFQILKKFF